jgi:hypothetical protein
MEQAEYNNLTLINIRINLRQLESIYISQNQVDRKRLYYTWLFVIRWLLPRFESTRDVYFVVTRLSRQVTDPKRNSKWCRRILRRSACV